MRWDSPVIRRLVQLALQEDSAHQDITTKALIPVDLKLKAEIRAKKKGVVCGLPFAKACFQALDPRVRFIPSVKEGTSVKSGAVLARIEGRARAILSAERSALNAVQHLSGIATFTRDQVRRLRSSKTALYDTRKTLPGWRELQKYAVACGGGKNHRLSLSDGVLIKENHLRICRLLKKDWIAGARRLVTGKRKLMELEVQTPQDFRDALRLHPRQVLLDNMRSAELKKRVKQLRNLLPDAEIEVSGGVRPDQISSLSRLGVDRISMGRLTHSAPALDCALDITHVYHSR